MCCKQSRGEARLSVNDRVVLELRKKTKQTNLELGQVLHRLVVEVVDVVHHESEGADASSNVLINFKNLKNSKTTQLYLALSL